MNKIKIILAFCLIVSMAKSQNFYGATSYPHTNYELSSGIVTHVTPGFLLAGFAQTNSPTLYNFTIDKLDIGGTLGTPPNSFQNGYKFYARVNTCNGQTSQILNCSGISVIESNGFAPYAIVGAVNFACFFAKLDNNGNILNKTSYRFPGTPSNITKPIICQSADSANRYYTVGSYDGIMYLLKTDSTGLIYFQYSTDLSGSGYILNPKAIIESPYGSKDLVIVGNIDNGGNREGFYYQISSAFPTSGPSVFNRYHVVGAAGNTAGFYSIDTAHGGAFTGAGFLIGGHAESTNSGFLSKNWMLKVNPTGGLLWNTLIDGSTTNPSGKIWAVKERFSAVNGIYENYGVTGTTAGMTVYKLDDNGIPFNVNYPGQQDEFVFNTGSSTAAIPVAMTYNNIGASLPDEGLHIYGNLNNSSVGDYYFVESYFNGYSGCNTPASILSYDNSSSPAVNLVTNAAGGSLTYCPNIIINSTPLSSYNSICGPYGSVMNGSNNRSAVGIETHDNKWNSIAITPNPTNNKAVVSYSLNDNAAIKVNLYDCLGQKVKCLEQNNILGAGNYNLEIDFENLNVPSGIYFIQTTIGKSIVNQKIIYNKQ